MSGGICLPVEIPGVAVLAIQNDTLKIIVGMGWIAILVIASLIFTVLLLLDEETRLFACFTASIVILATVAGVKIVTIPRFTYLCTVDSEVSFVELYRNYEISKVNGCIYHLKERR